MKKSMSGHEVEALAHYTAMTDLSSDMSHDTKLKLIDVDDEVSRFLRQCSKTRSTKTQALYQFSIEMFVDWLLDVRGNDLLHATYSDADAYIAFLVSDKSPNTVRTYVCGVAAFYSFLQRRHKSIIDNVFSKCRLPKQVNLKIKHVPTKHEIKVIVKHIAKSNKQYAALFEIMMLTGLRSGAFTKMVVSRNGRYSTITKGKRHDGKFDKYCMALIRKHFGPISSDNACFAQIKAHRLQQSVCEHTKRLFAAGKIKHNYTCHRLRDYFACEFYKKTKDIHALKTLMNHSGISTTERYLTELSVKLAH